LALVAWLFSGSLDQRDEQVFLFGFQQNVVKVDSHASCTITRMLFVGQQFMH